MIERLLTALKELYLFKGDHHNNKANLGGATYNKEYT